MDKQKVRDEVSSVTSAIEFKEETFNATMFVYSKRFKLPLE